MSDQKQVQVTLEELVLKQADLEQFYAIAGETLHKYAVPFIAFIESKIKEQLEAKVAKLQKEYQEELAKANLNLAEAKGELSGFKEAAELAVV